MEFDTSTQSGKQQALAAYKSEVAANPDLSFKTFCDSHGITDYKKLLWWCNDQGISIYALQGRRRNRTASLQVQKTDGAFIQFTPARRPSSGDLRGVSITFPDGVNLTLQECGTESVISLLAIYQQRKAAMATAAATAQGGAE